MKEGQILDNWFKVASMRSIPLQASLELTNRCNQKCSHCYVNEDIVEELLYEDWKKILLKLRGAGVLYVVFMGGEALLHPEFFKILCYAEKLSFHTSIITNGLLLNEKNVKKLKLYNISQITLSLYSMDSTTHDLMTGKNGAYKLLMNAITLLKKYQIRWGINSLLTKENIEGYFDLLNFSIKENVKFNSEPVVTCDQKNIGTNLNLRPSIEQLKKFYKKKLKLWPKSIQKNAGLNLETPLCNVARLKCAVDMKGNLLPCIELREKMGNLLDDDFEDSWNSELAQKYRGMKFIDLKEDLSEDWYNFCEHCPGMGISELNDPLKIPEYLKDLAKIQEDLFNDYGKK